MRSTLTCPECGAQVEHEHGYLAMHTRNMTRGDLLVGSKVCDGSNSRPRVPLKTVQFTGTCPACHERVHETTTETYPGSLEHYGGIRVVTHDCDPVESFLGEPIRVPVTLTDNYVINEPA